MNFGSTGQRVAGFTVVTLMLIIASDFEPVAPVAVAFAWLIFVGLLMTLGPAVFAKLSSLSGPATAADTQP